MRSSFHFALVLVTALAACGNDGGTGGDDVGIDASTGGETPAFTITSKDVTLQPGEEVTYCYYFHTPNTANLAIKKWSSDMQPVSHHVIMFFGSANQPADGTLSANNCGSGIPIWIYASQTAHGELTMPQDDGAGKPLGMNVPANQAAYLQIHYLNATDAPVTAPVTLNAYAYADGTAYTPTAAYITYNQTIKIMPHEMGHLESRTCNVPAGATFWTVSTHAHKQAVATDIKDGGTMVFSSTDWEHPGAKSWMATPFYKFASNKMTYECTYDNVGDNAALTIESGPSAVTNEMCMGTGYFFPATAAKFCIDNQGPI
jgi:hypothetical protein